MGLIIVGLGFLSVLLAILLFDWLKKLWRVSGVLGSLEDDKSNHEQFKQADFYGDAKSISKREKKKNPHFDALVDAEWEAASHLEAAALENESDELHSLEDLLNNKHKKA